MIDFTSGALPYAERLGWKVFLLAPGSKIPYFPKECGGQGVHDATSDVKQIREWGRVCPHGNIGLACGAASGIVAVDVDPRNDGHKSLAALAAKGRVLPPGPRQRTGNRGWHYLLKVDSSIGGSNGRLGPGIEIKSTGGYILVAPSFTEPSNAGSGGPYVWELSPFDAAVPRMPIWMMAILAPPRKPLSARFKRDDSGPVDVESLANWVSRSTVGERNARLYWASCRLGEMAKCHKVSASAAGRRIVMTDVDAGLTDLEAARTVDSGFKKSGLGYKP